MSSEAIPCRLLPYGEQGFEIQSSSFYPWQIAIVDRILEVLYSPDSSERKAQRLVDVMVEDHTVGDAGNSSYFDTIGSLVWHIRTEHPWQNVLLRALRLARRLENVSTLHPSRTLPRYDLCC